MTWAADPANATVGWIAPVLRCPVGGCPHARGPFRLCEDHRRRFTRMGMAGASTDEYVAPGPPVIVRAGAEPCGLSGCGFPVLTDGLCDGHRYRWTKLGRPPLAELPAVVEQLRYPGFSLAGLPPLLRLEFGYLLQVRTDRRRTHIPIKDLGLRRPVGHRRRG